MTQAIVTLAMALGQVLDMHYKGKPWDRETLELIDALSAWVRKHKK